MNLQARGLTCVLLLTALALLNGCTRSLAAIQESSAVRQRVRAIAGANAISCGDNLFPSLVAKNNACAIGAMTEHAPFYIVWNIPSGSSSITRGIVMNQPGEMFMVSETREGSRSNFKIAVCPSQKLVPDATITTASVLTCNP